MNSGSFQPPTVARLVLVQARREDCELVDHLLLLHEATSEVAAADVLICKVDDERERRAVLVFIIIRACNGKSDDRPAA